MKLWCEDRIIWFYLLSASVQTDVCPQCFPLRKDIKMRLSLLVKFCNKINTWYIINETTFLCHKMPNQQILNPSLSMIQQPRLTPDKVKETLLTISSHPGADHIRPFLMIQAAFQTFPVQLILLCYVNIRIPAPAILNMNTLRCGPQ